MSLAAGHRIPGSDRGATAVEYAALLALVVVVALAGLTALSVDALAVLDRQAVCVSFPAGSAPSPSCGSGGGSE